MPDRKYLNKIEVDGIAISYAYLININFKRLLSFKKKNKNKKEYCT